MAKIQRIPGIAKVQLGQTIPSPSVNRVDVADGTKGRCILLSPDWYAVSIAYTETPKRAAYFVDQEKVLKYALNARVYYVAVVARLNTGANGKVLDDSFRIEYLRLSEDVYNEFANDALEMEGFDTVALTKVTKGQFSYIKPKASSRAQDSKIIKSVREKLKSFDINALFQLTLISLAHPFEDYLKALEEAGQAPKVEAKFSERGALPPSFQASALPSPEEAEDPEEAEEAEDSEDKDEFSSEDDFDEFSEDE